MKQILEFLILLCIGGVIYMAVDMAELKPKKIPMEDFFKNPEMASFQLSPNGEKIAYMKPWKRRMNVYVRDMETSLEKRLTGATERGVYGYFWLNDERIAYVQDQGGDENIHIYGVNIDGSNNIDLTPFENIKARITDDMEDDPNHMIISLNKRNERIYDVYRLDINTGEITMIAENPGTISSWMTDHDGQLRIAITTDGVNSSILYRE